MAPYREEFSRILPKRILTRKEVLPCLVMNNYLRYYAINYYAYECPYTPYTAWLDLEQAACLILCDNILNNRKNLNMFLSSTHLGGGGIAAFALEVDQGAFLVRAMSEIKVTSFLCGGGTVSVRHQIYNAVWSLR